MTVTTTPTNERHARRPVSTAIAMLLALVAALGAFAVVDVHEAHAHGTPGHTAEAAAQTLWTPRHVALKTEMRRLWEDHVTWTRLAVISLTTDSPDTQATVGRLLRNQADIGDAVTPFYGKAVGKELTRQLRRHILIAADVVAAARAGASDRLADAQARWRRNGEDIAAALHGVNPRHWTLPAMKRELATHLRLTTDEVVARLQGDWKADVTAYEKIHHHAMHLSDLLSDGLVAQFPQRFR